MKALWRISELSTLAILALEIGFFAWYQGMALGGVAAIGKLQLAQPALTLVWSALLLGEQVSWLSAAAAAVVIAAAALGRNARVGQSRIHQQSTETQRASSARKFLATDDSSQANCQVSAMM